MGSGSSARPGALKEARHCHVSLNAGANSDDSVDQDQSTRFVSKTSSQVEFDHHDNFNQHESSFFATGYLGRAFGKRTRNGPTHLDDSVDDFDQDDSEFLRQVSAQIDEYSTTLKRITTPKRQVSGRIEKCATPPVESVSHKLTTSTAVPSEENDDGATGPFEKEAFNTSAVSFGPEWAEDGAAKLAGFGVSCRLSDTFPMQAIAVAEDSQDGCAPPGCVNSSPRKDSDFLSPRPRQISSTSRQSPVSPRCRQTSDRQWHTPQETLVLLDWDDTLCPTSACKELVSSTPTAEEWSSLVTHTAEVAKFLRNAAELGRVVIVTMAKLSWVNDCITMLMNGISDLLQELGIKIVSARDVVNLRGLRCASSDSRDPSQYLKTQAMESVIKKFYKACVGGRESRSWKQAAFAVPRKQRSWKNIVSIGDSSAERLALQDVVFRRMQRGTKGEWKECRCKTVLLLPEPSLEQLTKQVRMLQKVVGTLVHHNGDLDVDVHADNIGAVTFDKNPVTTGLP